MQQPAVQIVDPADHLVVIEHVEAALAASFTHPATQVGIIGQASRHGRGQPIESIAVGRTRRPAEHQVEGRPANRVAQSGVFA
jgi:hypothetical protein